MERDRSTIDVRTVFISSRTIELASERRSAYESVASLGLVPLMFESTLNRLNDPEIVLPNRGSLDRRGRIPNREIRKQIDSLIDKADLFLGIYSSTLGPPDPRIHDLRWLEYEIVRFVARYVANIWIGEERVIQARRRGKNHVRALAASRGFQRLVLSHKEMALDSKQSNNPRSLRRRLAGRIHDVLRERVRLFQRKLPYEEFVSTNLTRLLASAPRHTVPEFSAEILPPAGGIRDHQYIPSDASLYSRIQHWIENGATGRLGYRVISTGSLRRYEFRVKIEFADSAGLIYSLLREWFQSGFAVGRLDALAAGDFRIRISVVLEVYEGGTVFDRTGAAIDRGRELARCTLRVLKDSSRELQLDLDAFVDTPREAEDRLVRWEIESDQPFLALSVVVERLAEDGKRETSDVEAARFDRIYGSQPHHRLGVIVADLPGIVWSISSLIASYGCGVRALLFRSTEGEEDGDLMFTRTAFLRCEFDEGDRLGESRPIEFESKRFIYQLRKISGVIHIHMPPQRLRGRKVQEIP